MNIKCQISDPIWWGYNIIINLDRFYNLEGIIEYVLDNLESTLKSLNLLPQAEFLQKVRKDFHIHNMTFEQILTIDSNETIYICRHSNIENDTIKFN